MEVIAAERQVAAAQRDVTAAEREVAAAERQVAAAARELDDLGSGPSATDLAASRASVASAASSVAAAELHLAELRADPDPGELEIDREELDSARASLVDAEVRLADLLAGADASDIRESQAAVTRAEIDLAELRGEADPLAIERQELDVADATRQLEAARASLAGSVLTAPIAGVVLTVDNHVGERVSGSFITLGAADSLRARVKIDESDIGSIELGQPVDLTFQALGDRSYRGEVSWIAAQGEVEQSLVTFEVDIALDAADQQLRAGLSSDVLILIAEVSDVIVVPKAAVQTAPRGGVVVVVGYDQAPERRLVQTGLSDAFLVEITSGLEVGELVRPNAAQALADLRAAEQLGGGGDGPAGGQPGAQARGLAGQARPGGAQFQRQPGDGPPGGLRQPGGGQGGAGQP